MLRDAEGGAHVVGKLGNDIEAEAGTVGAHGDFGRAVEAAVAERADEASRESGAVVADVDADFAVSVEYGEMASGVDVGVAHGVGAEVIDNAVQEVAVCEGEAGAVCVRDFKVTMFETEGSRELAVDFVAEAADADRLDRKEAVFEAGDFVEIVNLAKGAVGDEEHLRLDAAASGGVGGEVEGKGKLAHETPGSFQVMNSSAKIGYLHEDIIARSG